MAITSVKVRNYRCFKKHWVGFDGFSPINVIIGRNNSGKSHLLEIVSALCGGQEASNKWSLKIGGIFDEDELKAVFPPGHLGNDLGGNHWGDHGKYFVGKRFEFTVDGPNQTVDIFDDSPDPIAQGLRYRHEPAVAGRKIRLLNAARKGTTVLRGKVFKRLFAERDVRPETESKELRLAENGLGATNIIRRYLVSSSSAITDTLIRQEFRGALNEVFGSDGHFTDIEVKHHDEPNEPGLSSNSWEIFLREEKKGAIALSKSGSGLKTVILVLLNLIVVPAIDGKERKEYVFGLEELENNLHPALLRRLFAFITRYVTTYGATVFLTTHSSVALDVFGVSSDARIIHVTHDRESTSATAIAAHFDRQGVVTELGAKPSDILQANGIIWVEGPSDRIYLSRWIDLVSNGELKEGRDFVCACYGGALLARTQFASPETADDELVNLLRVNPNIVVVCDSDRTSEIGDGAILKKRVERIQSELAKVPGAVIWVTTPREIENYLPAEVLCKVFAPLAPPDPKKFDRVVSSEKDSFAYKHLERKAIDKVELAIAAGPHMTVENLKNRFDWTTRIEEIVAAIRRWNTS